MDRVPAGSCDCHIHIFDGRYPMAAGDTRNVPDALVPDYRRLQQRLGTTRVVIVQPSTYGTDNRCTLAALNEFGAAARGVAVVDTTVSDAELARLAEAGIRGIRFNIARAGATTVEMMEPLSWRVHELGWHVQLHMHGDGITQIEDLLNRLPTPIVFDHLGRIPQPAGVAHPAFRVIANLLDRGAAWVKLSGAYMDTNLGPPGFADITTLAQAFIQLAPERMLWGSDWPHPSAREHVDDALLFDLLWKWAPDSATQRMILVENPARLYGFGPL
jgi:D-galactarolactone isomerase